MNKSVILLMIAVSLMCPYGFCMEQAAAERAESAERGSIIRRYAPIYRSVSTAFADAFADPNIVIGVFDRPSYFLIQLEEIDPSLPSEQIIEIIRHYSSAGSNFNLIRLRCLELIQGDMTGPYAFISTLFTMTESEPHLLTFSPPLESKWIVALRKTTPEYRAARFLQDMGQYKFLNDDTFFTVWGFQYGALCLKWPEKIEQRFGVVNVSEDIVDDFKIMYELSTDLRKSRLDLSRAAEMAEMLETEQAKSIFAEILRKMPARQDNSFD